MQVTRTYLELRDRSAFRPFPEATPGACVARVEDCPVSFYRYLYTEVGRPHGWRDRLDWTDAEIRAHIADQAVSVWVLSVRGAPAGYFELVKGTDTSVELAYFGLVPEFTGRGLGKWLLSTAVECAWSAGAARIWLHTCSLDHPAALPNYLRRGFTPFKTEHYTVKLSPAAKATSAPPPA